MITLLEQAEETRPDPSDVTDDLIQAISAMNLDSSGWSHLLDRFAASPSPAVSAALAWALVEDAKGHRRVSLGEVLRFAESVEVIDHPGVAGGVLMAVAERLPRTAAKLEGAEAARLRTLLLRSFQYAGKGPFQVQITVLDVLEKLGAGGAIDQVLTRDSLPELHRWLRSFLEIEREGPFAESAARLLRAAAG